MKHATVRHSRRQFLTLVAAVSTAGVLQRRRPAGAQEPATVQAPTAVRSSLPPDASPQFRAIAEVVARTMAAANVPGAALGIAANGREEIATFGDADLANGTPVTPATRFEMGSVTKSYTATAAMRLVEAGKLDLEAH
jgi:CubicO group peptidase (beta-lactamase class C family)